MFNDHNTFTSLFVHAILMRFNLSKYSSSTCTSHWIRSHEEARWPHDRSYAGKCNASAWMILESFRRYILTNWRAFFCQTLDGIIRMIDSINLKMKLEDYWLLTPDFRCIPESNNPPGLPGQCSGNRVTVTVLVRVLLVQSKSDRCNLATNSFFESSGWTWLTDRWASVKSLTLSSSVTSGEIC